MRIFDFFIIFGTTFITVSVHSKPIQSYSTISLDRDTKRIKKRHEDSSTGYLEPCSNVTFPKAQQGVVNVLAFLDSSWLFSHKQAIMLKMLNERLRRTGLPDTLFFVINVDPSSAQTVNNFEDDIEREAWSGVSPDETETYSNIIKTTVSLATDVTPDIQLIQDNEKLEIWKKLGASRDQVFVIDRCGRLTYQVIVPWSILHFPYVKAAILSTYNDEPCGSCDLIYKINDPFDSKREKYLQNDREDYSTVATESGRIVESSMTDNNQSGSTNYLMTEVIDFANEATTMRNFLNDEDNYTTINSDFKDLEEFINSTSNTYNNIGEVNKVETDAIAISRSRDNDSTNFTNNYEMSDYKIRDHDETLDSETTKVLRFKEKSVILENIRQDFSDLEENFVTSLRNFINSDATDSTVSYYDRTASIYAKYEGSDTTTEEILKSYATELIEAQEKLTALNNWDGTQSSVEKDDAMTSVDLNDDGNGPIAQETLKPHTTESIEAQEKLTALNNWDGTQSSVEKVDAIASIDLNIVTMTGREADSATTESQTVETTTKETDNSNVSSVLRIDDEDKDSEGLQDRFNENSEIVDTPLLSDMPLRIIMHAPHFHVDSDSTMMHEYLVMNTDNSKYHQHLASNDATKLYRGPQDFQDTLDFLKNKDIENKMWPMKNIIYNKDESPGLYSEVADYWKNSGGQENYDYTEEIETTRTEQDTEEPNTDERIWQTSSKSSKTKVMGSIEESTLLDDDPDKTMGIKEMNQDDFTDKNLMEKQAINAETLKPEDEETENKFIAHYSKLFPWIYYPLDK